MLHAVFSSMLVTHRAWQFGPGGMEDELEASFAFLSGHSSGGHGHPEVPRKSLGRPKKIKRRSEARKLTIEADEGQKKTEDRKDDFKCSRAP